MAFQGGADDEVVATAALRAGLARAGPGRKSRLSIGARPWPGRVAGLPPDLAPAPSAPATSLPPGAIPANALPPGAIPATPERLPGTAVAAPAPVPTPFPIMPEAGPWAICAAHYTGPDAIELARQVCLELRNKHRLPAYIFNHAEAERRKHREEMDKRAAERPGFPCAARWCASPNRAPS